MNAKELNKEANKVDPDALHFERVINSCHHRALYGEYFYKGYGFLSKSNIEKLKQLGFRYKKTFFLLRSTLRGYTISWDEPQNTTTAHHSERDGDCL